MKPAARTLLLICFLVFFVACRPVSSPATPAGSAPPAPPATSVARPRPATDAPSSTTASPSGSTLSVRQPFDGKWDDRAVFRSGLIQDEQKALDQLQGASVYHLDVQIADDCLSLQGRLQVRYTNQENKPLDVVYFQLFPNISGGKSAVSAVKVDGQDVQAVYEFQSSSLRVPLTTALQPGKQVVIQMDMQVQLPREMGGNYGLFGYLDNILVLDEFYPVIPAYDDQGWHAGALPPNADSTYQDVSFYLVRVAAPANLTVVASGNVINRETQENRQVLTFAAGPARDFYIAASDRFTVVSEKVGETTVNSYAIKEREQVARQVLQIAMGAVKSYAARFGVYPYTELDLVSTPMQALGIEYPGITGISVALYDPNAKVSGTSSQVLLEGTVAHEVGHQWFYNVVGNDQINQPWLDESVVQYVTGLYFLDTYGKQGYQGYRDSWLSRWDRVQRSKIPVGMPAETYQGAEYSAIVYGRGALFVEALADKMGQATFDKFLRDYYGSHEWDIGTSASFRQLAEKHCQCDLTSLFDEWVYTK